MFIYLCVFRHFRHYAWHTVKSYSFFVFGRFAKTRSCAPSLSAWDFLDLKNQEMTTNSIKNVHPMHNWILFRYVLSEKI